MCKRGRILTYTSHAVLILYGHLSVPHYTMSTHVAPDRWSAYGDTHRSELNSLSNIAAPFNRAFTVM